MAQAAAAAASAVIDHLDKVEDILVICEFGNNADGFILCHGIVDMVTFELMPPNKVGDIVKVHSSQVAKYCD